MDDDQKKQELGKFNTSGNNDSTGSENNPVEKFRRLVNSSKETIGLNGITRNKEFGPPDDPNENEDNNPPDDVSMEDTKQIKVTPVPNGLSNYPMGLSSINENPTNSGEIPFTVPPNTPVGDQTPYLRRVDEVDHQATSVNLVISDTSKNSPKNSKKSVKSKSRGRRNVPPPSQKKQKDTKSNIFSRIKGPRKMTGCLIKSIILFTLGTILIGLGAVTFGIIKYFSIAASLPSVAGLRDRASQFETTRILDREGNVLYEILDPNAGRRTYVPLSEISPNVLGAIIATEDKDFYNNPGFDPFAIARALWSNYTSGEIVSGASTITQQLSRTLLLDPAERYEQTVERKTREIVLAAEITRRYSKDEILELYLNEIYFGNFAYGIQAAAETYFNKGADDLSIGQAAFLAGLPQAPSVYDITSNRDATLIRAKQVLVLMYQVSEEENCIRVSNTPDPVCVNAEAATQAASELEDYDFNIKQISYKHPHWVNYIRSLLEEQYDSQTIYRSGFSVYTSLDPKLQERAEEVVKEQVETMVDRNATNGALVAIKPSTGEILAMVGSADFENEDISGQINMAISPRQPGSAMKPLTYLAAFEKGWTPSTLIWDVESEFPPSGNPDDTRDPYIPVNYDGEFHGPVTVRTALANSLNVPAVKTLDFVKIYDNPETQEQEGFIKFAERMGITTLDDPDYGLSLTLGGGEVTLLDLTNAYSTMANGGSKLPLVSILKIEDFRGNKIYEYEKPEGEQVIRPEYAYQINSILSDNEARAMMFGRNSILNLGFEVAAKTGTTNDFRDNWTMGYTPDLAVGVWVGNADYTPMINTTGVSGAAPIWAEIMQFGIEQVTDGNPSRFSRPDGIVEKEICEISGTEPSEWCPSTRQEVFAFDQLPLDKEEDLWRELKIDTWTELESSSYCSDFVEKRFALNVKDKWAIKWLEDTDGVRNGPRV